MGLISGILTLPLAPVRGVAWVAEQMKRQAEHEYYDPGVIQRELLAVDDAFTEGQLTERERNEIQEALLQRLFEAQRRRQAGEM